MVMVAMPQQGVQGLLKALQNPSNKNNWSLVAHVVALFVADIAVLSGVEAMLVSPDGGASRASAGFLFVIGGVFAGYWFRLLLEHAGQTFNGVVREVQHRIFKKLDDLDLSSIETLGADTIHRRMTLDAPIVAQASIPLVAVCRYIARASAASFYLLFLAPKIALGVMGAMAVFGGLRFYFNIIVRKGFVSNVQNRDKLQVTMRSMIAGFTQLRLHRPRGDALLRQVVTQSAEIGHLSKAIHNASLNVEAVAMMILYALIALLGIVLGAIDSTLSSQVLIVVLFVLRSVNQLTMHLPELQKAGAAFDALHEMERQIDLRLEARPLTQEIAAIPQFSSLRLDGVAFCYGGVSQNFYFGPVDLDVQAGEVLFITGPNGSGKSTSLKLLLGLYPPMVGEVVVNGQGLSALPPQAFLDLFSVVLSEFVLFDHVVSVEPFGEARAKELLAYVELSEKVQIAKGRFSTVALSTGQRKRLAMVVALLQDRPVFVFDEWAADQDPEFRDAFYTRILPDLKLRGKTVISVTHDDQFFDLADRRVIIQAGQVVA